MSKLILIVEDDPKSLKLTRDLLQVSGYETIEAVNGLQGIELAQTKNPDLILMDLMMPKMDGYNACSKIKADQVTKVIPVIMLTAVGHELNKKFAMEMGADGYITKPFTSEELLDAISRFLPTP
jgi:CheY-like chemotaxis protein